MIGILAYGSLIEYPGVEIKPVIQKWIEGVKTPFKIEFARTSSTRGGAPTVVPVEVGGSQVLAKIIVLKETVTLKEAEDLLWRRETRNECSAEHYSLSPIPSPNKMVVEHLKNFEGIETVIYTGLGANINDLSAKTLVSLAIKSAKSNAGAKGMDGISYLMALKRQKITTPLMADYENGILQELNVRSLEEAISICRE